MHAESLLPSTHGALAKGCFHVVFDPSGDFGGLYCLAPHQDMLTRRQNLHRQFIALHDHQPMLGDWPRAV